MNTLEQEPKGETPKKPTETIDRLIDVICQFGDGEAGFKTKDVNTLIDWSDQLEADNKSLIATIEHFDMEIQEYKITVSEKQAEIDMYRNSLEKIMNWDLPETGKFWDEEKTRPMSYESCFGSKGASDYIKSIAIEILNKQDNHADNDYY